MGIPMATRLLEKGYEITVYNRTLEKAKLLEEKGAKIAENVSKAIKDTECIILMLADKVAIEDTLINQSDSELKDKVVIQMGTIAPFESVQLQKSLSEKGASYLECPVLGSIKEALGGHLILMAGAEKKLFEKWKDVLSAFGEQVYYIGEVGKAAAVKLALNHLIAAHALSFSLSLGLVEKNNVDKNIFMSILRDSALYAPMFDKKFANWEKRSYENPNFPLKHLLKDVNLIMGEASDKNLNIDLLDVMSKLIKQGMERGLGEKDYSSVFNVINKI